jgi:hypothetical protein
MRSGNIQQHNLIRTSASMPISQLSWITSIHNVHKLHAFHHASAANIQASNDPLRQHG